MKFKKVKYRVTTDFGESKLGEIRTAYIVCSDGSRGLLYHPAGGKDTCASLEICHQDGADSMWVSINDDAWVNVTGKKLVKLLKSLTRP